MLRLSINLLRTSLVIVFLVIRTMVVPPILKVLDDRDAMVAKTAEDNRAAAASYEDADTEYRAALKDARADATGIRDQARAEGNEQLSAAKKRATDEADAAIAIITSANSQGQRIRESRSPSPLRMPLCWMPALSTNIAAT